MTPDRITLLYKSFIKEATVGTNTSTAMSGNKQILPKSGKLKAPTRMMIGSSRGFDPKDSVLGTKSD